MKHYYSVYRLLLLIGLIVGMLPATQAQTVNCHSPYRLNVLQVTTTSASITYSEANGSTPYSVAYAPAGAPASAAIILTGTTSPVVLTGLIPATTYQVTFHVTCGASGQTSPVESLSFRTDCTNSTTYPYSENFDGLLAKATPCGYTVADANNDGYVWNNQPSYPNSAPNAMRYSYNPAQSADDWFFTRGLQMQAGMSYQLQFKYRGYGSLTEALEVTVGNTAAAASQTTTLFANNSFNSATYTTTTSGTAAGQVASFTPAASGLYYFGFHALSPANQWYIYVDDIQVTASAVTATKSTVVPGFRAEASPVPFGGQLSLSLNTLQAGPLSLTLHDAVGRVVRQHSTAVPAGASSLAVPEVGTLPAGVYLLTVRQGGNTQVIRVAHE